MEILKNVSNHLWNYKTQRGLSINGLAEELNLGRTTIYKCLHGDWNPSLSTLVHLAQQMGLSLEELVSPVRDPQSPQEDTKELLLQLKRVLETVE